MKNRILHFIDKLWIWLRNSRSLSVGTRRRNSSGSNLKKGDSGERLAYEYLRSQGYRIVARKYRRPLGEIDLIGWDQSVLSFVEVKLRTQIGHGRPEEAVTHRKQRQICRVAREYRKRYHLHDINYRFDVVSILDVHSTPCVQVIKGAFVEKP
jgi:putative endonuclease